MPESVWKIDPGRCCQHSTNETFRDSKKRKCAIWKKDWIYGSEQEPLMRLRVRPILVLVQKSSLKGEVAMRQELIFEKFDNRHLSFSSRNRSSRQCDAELCT